MKMKNYVAGLYFRLSQEDERQGESVSIDNQRAILRKYAQEHGFTIYDEYIDDGVSGTTFDRPQVQRLLDDAKTGVINTILVKDLSRFGRNYIEVGQYIDYVFPAFGIRFIAIQDNVDTENRDSGGMEMMPIMNVFNEWHAANTSKKIRAVKRANAKEGIYTAKKASYGYIMGTDKKRAPIIDEEVAPIVRRIFEMYASGKSSIRIAETLNLEGIPSPAKYAYEKFGQKSNPNTVGLWSPITIREMLNKVIYIGHMQQLRWTSLSYKNHKRFRNDENESMIVYNTHEPIISQELWDRVRARQKSAAQGRKTKVGYTHPLSGFLFCADCKNKMRLRSSIQRNGKRRWSFDCGYHMRYGRAYCFSHVISARVIEEIVLDDIRAMAQRIVLDEEKIKADFIRHNTELADKTILTAKKTIKSKQQRIEELDRLMQVAYEDRVKGRMPEELCMKFIEKYSTEQKTLTEEISLLNEQMNKTETIRQNTDDFIRAIKKYLHAPELTREMCYDLLERVVIGAAPKKDGEERLIEIVYKVDIASVLRNELKKR